MDEKLYSKRRVIFIDGREREVPVVHNNPEYQKVYEEYRQAGHVHSEALFAAHDASQTKYYEHFVVVARHDGRLIKIPVYSHDPDIQGKYKRLRQMGESHNSADMVVTGQSPGLGLTDTALLKYDLLHNQFSHKDSQARGDALAEEARKLGISTTGKFYHPGIAAKWGDPEAWVGSIDDIKDVCKRRKWTFDISEGEMKIGVRADLGKPLEKQFCATPPKLGA